MTPHRRRESVLADRDARPTFTRLGILRAANAAMLGLGSLAVAVPAAAAQDAPPQPAASPASPHVETVLVSARKREERLIDVPVAATALPQATLERYNIASVEQLATALPGINIFRSSGGGSGGNFEIRGVGRTATDYGAEQPVALVIDGFSFTRGHAVSMAFFDIANVEVLKGPQTLFFGKNSPAGVISLKTVSPGDTFEGFARASYEFRTENPVVEFGVSVPVVEDKLAIRVAGRGEFMQGGYLRYSTSADVPRDISPFETQALYPSKGPTARKFPGENQKVARFTAVLTPSDNFDATFKTTYSRIRTNDAGSIVLYACADGPGSHPYLSNSFFDDPATPGVNESLIVDPGQTCPDKPGKVKLERPTALPPDAVAAANPTLGDRPNKYFNRTRNILSTLEMNWRLGDITLTSVSGFWDYNQDEYTNYDYTNYAVVSSLQGEEGQAWTTELRAQSHYDGPVNFMVGAFYEHMKRQLDAPVQIFPLGPAPSGPWPGFYDGSFLTYHHHWDNKIESYSVFGEMVWEITKGLELSAGVRYTEEDRQTRGEQYFTRLDTFLPPEFNPFAPSGSVAHLRRKFDDVSPSATLSWHPVDDVMIYAAYKTGFQAAGTSNPGTFTNFYTCGNGCPFTAEQINDALTFDGTDVKGFELGIKGQFLGNRLRAELIGWRYKYSGLQVAIFNSDTTTFTIQNAASAINMGLEGSLNFMATDALELRGSFQYVNQKYRDYTNAQCYVGQNDPGASNYRPELAALCLFDPALGAMAQNMNGERFGGGPFQFKAGFTWDRPVGAGDWNIAFSGDVLYKQKGRPFLRQPGTAVPSYVVLDLSARVYKSGGPWEFSLICSNCTDEKYVVSILDKPLGKTGDLTGEIAMPRLITLQATYRW